MMMCVLPPAPTIMQRLFRRRASSLCESDHLDHSSSSARSGSPASHSDSSGASLESDAVRRLALCDCSADGAPVVFQELLDRLEPSEKNLKADRALFDELLGADAPMRLAFGLGSLDFEARKDAVRVFSRFLSLGANLGAERELVEHFRARPAFTAALLEGIRDPELAPHFGIMVCACGQHSDLARILFEGGMLLGLAEVAGEGSKKSVEVSLEAFATLREMLMAQKEGVAVFLGDHFDAFFATYNRLLQAHNYMVQRQALRLLGDLLLDRCFMKVMVSYVSSDAFLKLHMNLLRDGSRAVQLEAFHVFKLFVGNPRKPFKVHLIIFRNQDRIVRLLDAMASGRCGIEIAEEVRAVAGVVAALGPPQTRAGVH